MPTHESPDLHDTEVEVVSGSELREGDVIVTRMGWTQATSRVRTIWEATTEMGPALHVLTDSDVFGLLIDPRDQVQRIKVPVLI